jgi:hypothetical protein
MASGADNNPLIAYLGGTVNVFNSPVTSTGSHAALVDSGSALNVVGSTISGDVNGNEISDDIHTLGPDTVTLTSSKLTNSTGAAFKVEGADVNITVTNSTVDSGVGATQHTLLDETAGVFGTQMPFNSLVNLRQFVYSERRHPGRRDEHCERDAGT